MSSKRRLIILAVAFIILLLMGVLVFRRPSTNHTKPTETSEVDIAGTVIIDNTDRLSKILLSEQYAAVYEALATYIRDNINKSIEHATIISQPLVARDGSVSFTLITDKPETTFKVILDRSSKVGNITIRIPSHNYKKTLNVFSQTGD